MLVEGLGVVAESHLEEWLIRPAEKLTEDDDPADENHIKLFGPNEALSWVATPIVDDGGSVQYSGYVHHGSLDPHSVLPMVDPTVTLMGSFQKPDYLLSSRDIYDDENKTENWDEEAAWSPRQGGNGYHSETDMGIVRDADSSLQAPLIGGSNYGSGKYRYFLCTF